MASSRKRQKSQNRWKEASQNEQESQDLYALLQIDTNKQGKISPEEIRKAYYKISLKTHPDRCPSEERELATQKFQAIGRAYLILSTQNLRHIYDTTGRIVTDEELRFESENPNGLSEDGIDWSEWFRSIFERVSIDTLDKAKRSYQGSDEERKDLLHYYNLHQGNMDTIMSCVIFSTMEDEPRFRDIIQEAIQDEIVPRYDIFCNEPVHTKEKRKKKQQREAKESSSHYKKALKSAMKGDTGGLLSAISLRQKERHDDLFKKITSKYIKNENQLVNLKMDPMTDAEFIAMDKKLWGKTPRPKI